jgi:PAS domain S-box-containing protein
MTPLLINRAPPAIGEPRPEPSWQRLLAYLFPPFSAFVLCVAIVAVGAHLWQSRARVAAENEQNLHTIAHALAQQTARTLQAIDLTLIGVADSLRYGRIDWHNPDDPRIHRIMEEKRTPSSYIRSLFLIDAQGRLVHELNHRPTPSLDFADRAYFTAQRDNSDRGLYLGAPIVSRIIERWIIPVSRRMVTPDGAFDGVVAAVVEPRAMRQFFSEMNIGDHSVVAVFRDDGTLLVRYPDSPNSPGKTFSEYHLLSEPLPGQAFTADSPVDNIRRVYFKQNVPGARAFVLVGYAESAVFANWRHSMAAYAIIAPVLLVTFGGLSLLLFRYMARRESLVHALRKSEGRFRDFAEAASDRLWETDAEHRFTWHSGSHSLARYIGQTRWEKDDVVDPERHELWKTHKADLDARRPFRDFKFRRSRADGTTRYRMISGLPFYDKDGVFKGYRGTYRDITAQVLAQQQAEMHRDRFLRAIENLAEGFALYDAEDKLVVCNTQFRELYRPVAKYLVQGVPFEELLEACLRMDLIPEARDRQEAWRRQRMAEHGNPPNVLEVLRSGRWYQVREQRDQDGGTLFFVLDIHDQKTTELQNKALNERVRLQFESMPVACMVLSPEFEIIDWNPAAEGIFGYRRDEVLGKSPYGTIVPESVRPYVKNIEKRLLSGESMVAATNENLTKSGGIVTCEWYSTPILDGDQQCIGILGMAVDVTEKRKAEEKLRQAQRMEAVGQLTGGIAHDFNNLLQVIFGNAEILVQALKDRPQLARWADMTKTAAERGANLTQRLLAFSRQQVLAPTPVDLPRMLADFVELLNLTLGESIDVLVDAEEGLRTVMLDIGQLENALLNLALNARDAMPQGGRLIIKAGAAALPESYRQGDAAPEAAYIALSVADTGSGMSPAVLKRAVEPFFTTKDVNKGSGLGLSMVYGFVTQSGGQMRIDSQLGRGTTVTMWFPCRAPAKPPARTGHGRSEALPTGSESILVVEDDEMVRSYVTSQLESLGYAVREAANGPDALELLETDGPVDLLFTDIVMPGRMNGRELADKVTARDPATRVLFTSGYTDKADAEQSPLPSGAHFLSKPYYRKDLAQRVREVLDLEVCHIR